VRFEACYRPAERGHAISHSKEKITIRRIALDGSVEIAVLPGEEARRYREKARGKRERPGLCE
jgi:hypothetical protein